MILACVIAYDDVAVRFNPASSLLARAEEANEFRFGDEGAPANLRDFQLSLTDQAVDFGLAQPHPF
jgi:hypothetical protein